MSTFVHDSESFFEHKKLEERDIYFPSENYNSIFVTCETPPGINEVNDTFSFLYNLMKSDVSFDIIKIKNEITIKNRQFLSLPY